MNTQRIVEIILFLCIAVVFTSCTPPAEKKKKKEKEPINEHKEVLFDFDTTLNLVKTIPFKWV